MKNYVVVIANDITGKTQSIAYRNLQEPNQNLEVVYFGVRAEDESAEPREDGALVITWNDIHADPG